MKEKSEDAPLKVFVDISLLTRSLRNQELLSTSWVFQ